MYLTECCLPAVAIQSCLCAVRLQRRMYRFGSLRPPSNFALKKPLDVDLSTLVSGAAIFGVLSRLQLQFSAALILPRLSIMLRHRIFSCWFPNWQGCVIFTCVSDRDIFSAGWYITCPRHPSWCKSLATWHNQVGCSTTTYFYAVKRNSSHFCSSLGLFLLRGSFCTLYFTTSGFIAIYRSHL